MSGGEAKAGKYEMVAVRWDRILSKPGEPLNFERFGKGDTVDLTAAEAQRLVKAGAVVKPGDAEKARVEAAKAQLDAALAALPEDLRAEYLAALQGSSSNSSSSSSGSGGSGSEKKPVQEDPASYNIADVMAYVGNDADKATAIAELEQARGDGKTPRSTLLDQLVAIAQTAGQS